MHHANEGATERHLRKAVDGLNGHTTQIVQVTYPIYGSWAEAVAAGAPHTHEESVPNMEAPAPLIPGTGTISVKLINFKRPVQNDGYALDWAAKEKKTPASPWLVMAMGEQFPELQRMFRQDFMYISSLTRCEFRGESRIIYLAYRKGRRQLLLAYPEAHCNEQTWFAVVGR